MQHKEYGSNFISGKSSTKRIHAPGGRSSIGSLLFGGSVADKNNDTTNTGDATKQINKENTDNQNQIKSTEKVVIEEKEESLKSDAEKVREFTFEAGQPTPDKPQHMNVDKVNFITKMILDEV